MVRADIALNVALVVPVTDDASVPEPVAVIVLTVDVVEADLTLKYPTPLRNIVCVATPFVMAPVHVASEHDVNTSSAALEVN